jgi:hypothetical protein
MRGTLGWPEWVNGRALENASSSDEQAGVAEGELRARYAKALETGDAERVVTWAGALYRLPSLSVFDLSMHRHLGRGRHRTKYCQGRDRQDRGRGPLAAAQNSAQVGRCSAGTVSRDHPIAPVVVTHACHRMNIDKSPAARLQAYYLEALQVHV